MENKIGKTAKKTTADTKMKGGEVTTASVPTIDPTIEERLVKMVKNIYTKLEKSAKTADPEAKETVNIKTVEIAIQEAIIEEFAVGHPESPQCWWAYTNYWDIFNDLLITGSITHTIIGVCAHIKEFFKDHPDGIIHMDKKVSNS